MSKRLFTSESVTEGHPDKLCDLIADGILDAALAGDPYSRIAAEVCTTTDFLMVFGEMTTAADVDIERIARSAALSIGYDSAEKGLDGKKCRLDIRMDRQSPDIGDSVTHSLESREGSGERAEELGAGDQGMMFGFACTETPELMPLTAVLSHRLCARLAEVRKTGLLPYLRPDGKAQVTVEYDGYKPLRVYNVVLSAQHDESVTRERLMRDLKKYVVDEAIGEYTDDKTEYLINPSGRFVIGGPAGDSGVTGRKIVVDTYGGVVPHGGGAFSGKDPTKVDRSASYYARYVCKNMVAAGAADRLELQVAYAIGKANPVSLAVNSFGTGRVSDEKLLEIVRKTFDFRPGCIISALGLRRPIYTSTTNYGHFGKSGLPWEKTDRAEEITRLL